MPGVQLLQGGVGLGLLRTVEVQVVVDPPGEQAGRLAVADRQAGAAGQLAEVRVDGFGKRVFEARVERINPVTEQGSRQILLYLAIDNAGGALRGGMFAQGDLVIERSEAVLAIPAAAVKQEAGIVLSRASLR